MSFPFGHGTAGLSGRAPGRTFSGRAGGVSRWDEDELARLRVEEAALRAAAGEVDEEGWAQFDPARDGSENLEAV